MAQNETDTTTMLSVDAPSAAVRLMESATPEKSPWSSSDFISLVGTVAVNVITAATVVGWVDATQAQELTKAVTAMVAAVSVISVNGVVVWKYIAGKQAVEVQKIQAQYQYAGMVEQARAIALEYNRPAATKSSRRK